MCGCSKQTREGHGVRYFGAFASLFVSAVEFSVENSPALKKSVRQRKTLLEKKWRTKLKPETGREDGEEQRGSSGAPSVGGAGISGKPAEELRCS